jgi:hypothetical protein
MDPREQFFTDEFFRYSTECRRLARLARQPPGGPEHSPRPALIRTLIERLGEMQRDIVHGAGHGLVPRTARLPR